MSHMPCDGRFYGAFKRDPQTVSDTLTPDWPAMTQESTP